MSGFLKEKRKVLLGMFSVLLLVLGYWYISHGQHLRNPDDTTMPTFRQMVDGVKMALEMSPRSEERWLVVDSIATGKRLLMGLGIGIAGAVIFGLLMGCFKVCDELLNMPLTIFCFMVPTAMLAVFFVLFGIEEKLYVAMIAFGILPLMARSISLSIREVPMENINKAQTLGASKMETLWNIVFPQVRPRIIDNIRLAIGPAMIFLIAAEMVCADVGFGYTIRMQMRRTNMHVVYPYILMLTAFGWSADMLLKCLIRWLCPWFAQKEE